MSSGELLLAAYHRTESVGSGTYGNVISVFNNDGEQYALKQFVEDEDDFEYGLNLGVLREISILRILRGDNTHPNVVAIHDIQTSFGGEDEEAGAGTDEGLAIVMPLYSEGNLADSFSKILSKKQKVIIAHGILSAVAFLHSNSIIHRDIKSDNILLKLSAEEDDIYEPVLCDFSLSKAIHPQIMMGGSGLKNMVDVDVANCYQSLEFESTHTPSIGTPTYRAPEVVNDEPYSLPSDLWSVGVVLLELLRGKCLETFKDKGAISMIKEYVDSLPEGQPFPTLIRGLLQPDPNKRWTAQQALECDLFAKFGLSAAATSSSKYNNFRRIYLPQALPLDGDDVDPSVDSIDSDQNGKENTKNLSKTKTPKKKKGDSTLAKRYKTIQKVCDYMEWINPMTIQAALSYSIQMAELCDDVDDLTESTVLLDCIVVAHKFFEEHLSSEDDLNTMYQHFSKGHEFDTSDYGENESTLLLMMDCCLYPRIMRAEG